MVFNINKLLLYSPKVINILLTLYQMPYRRLPNTDTARLKALKAALKMGSEIPPHKLAFSPKILPRLEKLLPQFESGLKQQKLFLSSPEEKVKDYNEIVRKARLYISHFIRVMNMAIYRGELPATTRAFYGLPVDTACVPSLNTENELISWGKRIIDGETYRIKKGGCPITNPTIAVVKVRYEKFLEALASNRISDRKVSVLASKNRQLRKEADEIILSIWNDVENYFSSLSGDIKRKKCSDYGIVYYFRKGELVES